MGLHRQQSLGKIRPAGRRGGWTLIEVLVVVAIVVAISVGLMMAVGAVRRNARLVGCSAQLRGLWQSLRAYATDHEGRYPDPWASGKPIEGLLAPYLTNREAFRCPSDDELFPVFQSSYDWRDLPGREQTLAGRRMNEPARSEAVLFFDALPGWHRKATISVVRLSGAAELLPQDEALRDLEEPVQVDFNKP